MRFSVPAAGPNALRPSGINEPELVALPEMPAAELSCLGLRYDGITLDVTAAPARVAAFRDSLSRLWGLPDNK